MAPLKRVPRDFVALLDAVRIGAAVLVIYHHIAQANPAFALPIVARLGQEGVIVFFLLSGYVIFANEATRKTTIRAYAKRRIFRIYPVLIVAMGVAYFVGLAMGYGDHFSWIALLGNLLALQDVSSLKPGVSVDPFMGNSPLWSLSYEIVFYILFPFVLRAWKRDWVRTNQLVGLTSCLSFMVYLAVPNHFGLIYSYFLIWWVGAMAAAVHLMPRPDRSMILIPVGWLGAMTLIAVASLADFDYAGLGVFPVLMIRHFAGALVLIGLAFLPAFKELAPFAARHAALLSVASSLSYGLYAFHYPLMIKSGASGSILWLTLAGAVTIGLAWIFDRNLAEWIKLRFLGRIVDQR